MASLAAIGSQVIGVPLALVVRRLVRHYSEQSGSPGSVPHAPSLDETVTHTVRTLEAASTELSAAPTPTVIALAAGFVGVILLRGWLRWIQTLHTEQASARIVADMRHLMHERLHHVGLGYFDRRPVGRTIVRFTGDAGAIRGWVQSVLVRLPADVLTILAVAAALVLIHPALLPAAALPLTLLVPIMLVLHPSIRRWTRAGRRAQSRLSGLLATRLPAVPAFRCFGRTSDDDTETHALIDEIAHAQAKRGRVDAWVHGSTMAAGTASLAAVALVGLWRPDIGSGDLVAAIWLTLMVRGPVMRLGRASSTHQRAMISFDRIAALAGRPTEPGRRFVGPPPVLAGRRIALRNVGYRDHEGRWLLERTDLDLEGPGLSVLDGSDAISTTTTLELLVRLRRPHAGHLELDGHDLRSLPVDHVRQRIAFVDRRRSILDVAAALPADAWWDEAILSADQASTLTHSAASSSGPLHESPDPMSSAAGSRQPELDRLRAAIRLALANDPSVLMIDDPLRDLDVPSRTAAVQLLRQLATTRLLIVTGQDPALLKVGRVVPLADRQLTHPPHTLVTRAG